MTFAPEQDMEPPVTEPPALARHRDHSFPKSAVIGTRRSVLNCHAATADGFTRPPFAHPLVGHEISDSFPPMCGRHHFFPRRSFEATLSSIASASIRFSLAFSFSSARSFFASLTPCLRHSSETGIPASCSFKIPMICSSAKTAARHVLLLSMGQHELQTGLTLGSTSIRYVPELSRHP